MSSQKNWYRMISTDISNIPDFIEFYEEEMTPARADIKTYGSIEKNLAALPGIIEFRFSQLQEIEAVLNYLNIQLSKIKKKHYQKYLENYNRALSSRDAEKYAEGEEEVIIYETIINDVALIRNKWLGILKGLEQKSFSISNITRLRCSGLEDASL